MAARTVRLVIVAALAFLAVGAGCPFLAPAPLGPKETPIDPALVGLWEAEEHNEEESGLVRIDHKDEQTYRVQFLDEKPDSALRDCEAYLVSIGEARFLNVVLKGKEETSHSYARIEIEGDALTARIVNLEAYIESVERDGGEMTSDGIRAWIAEHLDDASTYGEEPMRLRRTAGDPPARGGEDESKGGMGDDGKGGDGRSGGDPAGPRK